MVTEQIITFVSTIVQLKSQSIRKQSVNTVRPLPLTKTKQNRCSLGKVIFFFFSGKMKPARNHQGQRVYKCRFCNKICPAPSKLKVHERIHTGERPYSCEICGKSFNEKGHLKNHMVVHFSLCN